MYNKNSTLASLLSSRICHDLANPLGAVNNGLELMELSGTDRTPEFELTASSIQNANAKLNFYRVAFGASIGKDFSSVETAKTLSDVFSNTRVSTNWVVMDDLSRARTKLAFLLILCLETSMPRGGSIEISGTNDQITLTASAETINCEGPDWDHLLGVKENEDLKPSSVEFELARACAMDLGQSIEPLQKSGTLTLTV